MRILVLLILLGLNSVIHADAIDLNLNDDSVYLAYVIHYGTAELDIGALYKEQDNDDDDEDWVAHLGLEAVGEEYSGTSTIEGGLGGRVYAASVGDDDVLALALGGHVGIFPGSGMIGLGLYGYYAPDILTGADAERFWEAGARINFKLFENARLYVGYREIEMRPEDSSKSVEVDDEAHVGIHIRF